MSVYDSIRNAIPPIHPEGHKFIAIFLVATLILGWLFEPLFWIGLIAYGLHLALQTRRIDPADGALALRLFRSNREAGFVLLFAIGLGALWPI